jgi:UDP-N-acetylglucosamine 4,6-dehydratase/5-epimerase
VSSGGVSPLKGKSVLITGGTGSFGRHFTREVLANHGPSRLAILSRDERKQYGFAQELRNDPRVRFFLGDVRDPGRVWRAFDGVEIVVHAAALKQVPAAEYNPFEFIKTNVQGGQNVIEAALDRGMERVIALGTDKRPADVAAQNHLAEPGLRHRGRRAATGASDLPNATGRWGEN